MVHKLLPAAEYLPGVKAKTYEREILNERSWKWFSDLVYRGQRFLRDKFYDGI